MQRFSSLALSAENHSYTDILDCSAAKTFPGTPRRLATPRDDIVVMAVLEPSRVLLSAGLGLMNTRPDSWSLLAEALIMLRLDLPATRFSAPREINT